MRLDPNPVIIIEGLLILHYEKIRNKIDLKLFIDTDEDIRLSRRSKSQHLETSHFNLCESK